MTIQEVISKYGYLTEYAQLNDSLWFFSRRVYGDVTDLTLFILTTLNSTVDWDNMVPTHEIKYIAPQYKDLITVL